MVSKNHKFYTRHYASQLLIITHIYVPVAVNVNCNSALVSRTTFPSDRLYTRPRFLIITYTTTLRDTQAYNAGIINELAKRPVRLDSRRVLVAISRNIQDN